MTDKSENTTGCYRGRRLEYSLYQLSNSELLDNDTANMVQAAADYIHWLEVQLKALAGASNEN